MPSNSYLLLDVTWLLFVLVSSLWSQNPSTRLINTKISTDRTTTMRNMRISFIISLGQLEPGFCLFCPRQHTFKWHRQFCRLTSYSGNVAVTQFSQPETLTTNLMKYCMYIQQYKCLSIRLIACWLSLYAFINSNRKTGAF